MSKYSPIDILKLYSGQIPGLKNTDEWNKYLRLCFKNRDVKSLVDFRYRLQCGMVELEKQKLTNQKIIDQFCRWIGSIEKTIRRINKAVNSNPNDFYKHNESTNKSLKEKRIRDENLEKYLRKNSY